ncbi:hypothetical protein PWT90_03343 [Aphanocladium album]|nr:hypothetical protein PWT90_03343 [Aphanocladium album]
MLSAFILELPLELRLSSFGFLPPRDIASTARACKALHTALQPVLYSHIDLCWDWQRDPPLGLLLRTLLARPELASYVQSLHFQGRSFDEGKFVVWRPEIPTLDVSSLPRQEADTAVDLFKLAGSVGDEWKGKLGNGNVDALVTLIVCLAPNLVLLQLGRVFAIETPVLGEVLRQSLCGKRNTSGPQRTLPAFSKLRQVSFPYRRQDASRRINYKNAADVLPLFYLPALESLRLSIDNPAEFVWPAGAAAPDASSVTSLQLFRIREQLLGYILSTVPRLRYLKWECFYQKWQDKPISQNTIDLDVIGAALAPVRESLVDLVLEAESDIGRGEIDVPFMKTSGSISGLRNLKRLKVLRVP